jgi:ketosteroid isomerase-like protein
VRLHYALLLAPLATAAANAQRPDTAATKASLFAADTMLAASVAARGAAAFFDAVEPDAAIIVQGQPIRAAAEARATFEGRYGGAARYRWHPAHAMASVDGRFGCTVGLSTFAGPGDTTRIEPRGVYATCWRRDASGRWRIVAHQRLDTPAAPPVVNAATVPGLPHSATVASGDAHAATIAADSAFAAMGALAAGPGPAFAAYAAPDAVLLSVADLPRGPVAIAAVFEGFPAARVLRWAPMRPFGAGSGGLAYTVGHGVTAPRQGAGPESHSAYLTVWRQEADGRWRYVLDLGTPRP